MKTNNTMLLIEVVGCLVLVLLLSSSWSTIRSPVEMYGVYLRELSVFRFSTRSVFLIGNLIIIVIVVQSTKLSEQTTPTHKVHFTRHQYHVPDRKINSSRPRVRSSVSSAGTEATDKFFSKETQLGFGLDGSVSEQSIVPSKDAEVDQVSVKAESSQLYRRTLSASYERSEKVNRAPIRPELTRSKTVKWGGGEGPVVAGRFDELNHYEFRRKIESFIAKQRRLIREELVGAGDV